ncbi:MAG: hypothetical protein CAK90_02960 [Spartobacteria bacterium AMD-G4]|nr:MAG: hypothetical protein CAK90_02960 [Spartobacteria bacterium AMD-G4]
MSGRKNVSGYDLLSWHIDRFRCERPFVCRGAAASQYSFFLPTVLWVQYRKNLPGLEGLVSRLLTLHVFHWTIGSYEKNLFDETERPPRWTEDFFRHPLVDGTDCWRRYLTCAVSTGRRISALLEFVREDSPENFPQDAGTLVRLCHEAS